MRTFLITLLAGACCASLRADFSYQDTTQMTGGALFNMMRALGPLARGARDPIVTTRLLKGNRMATIAKERTTIIDLDKETITEIDLAKKTYSVLTFAQMKQAMEDAMARAREQQSKGKQAADNPNVQANFKVSAKATGQTKNVGVLPAKELVLTMTLEGANKDTGESGAMEITVDSWMAMVPGYDEVKEFHRKMGEKIGYAFGSGMSQLAMTRPETLQGFAEVAKEINKVEGVPVQSTMKMGGQGAPGAPGADASASPQSSPSQQQSGAAAAAAALGRLGGFGRKKNNDQQQPAPAGDRQAGAAGSGSLVETTTELTSFSSAPVDASKFEVPAGFKQVQPEALQRRGR